MEFTVKSGSLSTIRTDCLIVTVYQNGKLSKSAEELDKSDGQISHWLGLKDAPLKAGTAAWLSSPDSTKIKRLLIVCLGESPEKTDANSIRSASSAVAKQLKGKNIQNATWSIDTDIAVPGKLAATLIAENIEYTLYTYSTSKTKNLKPSKLKRFTLHSLDKLPIAWKNGLIQGQGIAKGLNSTRELGNLPGNYCTPSYLADQAKALEDPQFKVKILEEKQLKKLGMGSFLSVAAGSEQPPKLIIMEYTGAAAKTKPTVLVGKGITFDTGGISLKPGLGMDEMKFDMCGAASVFGVMTAIKELKPKINVVAIVAATENMPSGKATKPGDVVTSMSGQTIEVLNTDAEGRLVLCDALTYAERYNPKTVIDIATLTGACVIALGNHASGLYANDQELADQLLDAGINAGDKAWQMPLWDEYQKSLDSNFADIANIGGREAGSVTAACFLSRFTEKYSWAHLDIAGTAWHSGGNKGATGRPVRLLLQYLTNAYSE